MSDRPNILVLGASDDHEKRIRAALADRAEVRAERLGQALAAAHRISPTVVIVDVSFDLDAAIGVMEDLLRGAPHLQLIALADRKDPDVILNSMRAGAREFALLDGSAELRTAIEKLLSRSDRKEAPHGAIVSVFPAKGGLGSTFMATNLAGMLAESQRKVVLVDLDLQLGDVLVSLDMSTSYAISDVVQNMHRLDRELLMTALARHGSGIHVLSQSDRLEESDRVTATQVGPLLSFLARHFDYVVVDGLSGFDEMSVAALDASTRVMLLVAQNVPALKNAQRCLDVFGRLGYGDEKVKLVVNRHQKNEKIDLQAIVDNLGTSITGVVSNDYPTVMAAIDRGQMLRESAPRSRVTQDLHRISVALSGGGMAQKSGGLLRGLFGAKAEKVTSEQSERGVRHGLNRAPEAV